MFHPEVYRRAALERMTDARLLYDAGRDVLAYYAAGAAVECILHAYRERNGAEHTAGHSLRLLAEVSGFLEVLPEALKQGTAAALGDVATRWSNGHRYRSRDELRSFLVEAGLHRLGGGRTMRGDVVRGNATPILEGAITIVTTGDMRWTSSLRS